MSQDKKEAFYNRSLERALCILNVFNTENTAFTVTELSDKLGLSRATIVRLCDSDEVQLSETGAGIKTARTTVTKA